MKKLILMRHAQSPKDSSFKSDFERSIDKKGESQAFETATYLHDHNIKLDKVICSSSVRTKETWNILQKNKIITDSTEYTKQIYNASEGTLIEFIQRQEESVNNLLLIAHNPSISLLSFIALKNNSESHYFSPATCIILEYNAEILWRDVIFSSPNRYKIFSPKG